jgi:predicted DNA-binding transcriptional regulator AlpA
VSVTAAIERVQAAKRELDSALEALARAVGYASGVQDASPVHASNVQSMQTAPVLLDVPEAAALLGLSEAALRTRINRCQVPGIVRTGRRIQFHRERLLSGLKSSSRRQVQTRRERDEQ